MADYRGELQASGRRFAILVSRFNDAITQRLLTGARTCLLEHGVADADIDVISVPGAWELPIAAELAASRGYAAMVAIGCVIRGETPHFEYVAGGAAEGLTRVSVEKSVPITLAVLTTENAEQALARAGGRNGNKGREAALAALELADLAVQLRVANA